MNERVPPFSDIGYHYVLTNAYPTFESIHDKKPEPDWDGRLWPGRDLDHDGNIDEEQGAHAPPWNADSLGVALVGRGGTFTGLQIGGAVAHCAELALRYQIPVANIFGHYEVPGSKKTCPEIEMDHFRELVRKRLS
jgi:hypothetical protein